MNLVCCQLDIVWEDKPANYDKVRELLRLNPPARESLIVLPEMFATGFSMDVAHIAENAPAPTESFLRELAAGFGCTVLGGIVRMNADGRGRNEAVAFGPDGTELTRYCKLHPFSYGNEDRHYCGGTSVTAFSWGSFQVAPFICYDLRFPEVFRAAVQAGATLLVVIANWPDKRLHHWLTLLQARAIENQAFVAGINRCGNDPALLYPGRTVVIDPLGQIVADAGPSERLLQYDIDPQQVIDWRAQFPALRDIRPAPLSAAGPAGAAPSPPPTIV